MQPIENKLQNLVIANEKLATANRNSEDRYRSDSNPAETDTNVMQSYSKYRHNVCKLD